MYDVKEKSLMKTPRLRPSASCETVHRQRRSHCLVGLDYFDMPSELTQPFGQQLGMRLLGRTEGARCAITAGLAGGDGAAASAVCRAEGGLAASLAPIPGRIRTRGSGTVAAQGRAFTWDGARRNYRKSAGLR